MSSIAEMGLPLEVISEDGENYTADAWQPTMDDVSNLWKRYEKYNILFSDYTAGNQEYFNAIMLNKTTVILVVRKDSEEIGILYITDIRPNVSADAHYFFWDKKTVGRQKLILAVLKWAMDEFYLHRVNTTVPSFAWSALHRIHCLGMRLEGRKKQAILSRGRWSDMFMFGVLRDELTEDVLTTGKIVQSTEEHNWHGLLDNNSLLMNKILNRREDVRSSKSNTAEH